MHDDEAPPASTDVTRLADHLAPHTRPRWTDLVTALLSALPTIGGPISTLLSQRQQRLAYERLTEVLSEVDRRISTLQRSGKSTHVDDEFAELVVNLAPVVARTRSQEKRGHFSALLSNAAEQPAGDAREEARTMALILDSLEYSHVALLHRLMQLPHTQSFDGLWGGYRSVPVDRTSFSRADGDLLLRLEGVGLIDVSDFRTSRDKARGSGRIIVRSLGIKFSHWVSASREMSDN